MLKRIVLAAVTLLLATSVFAEDKDIVPHGGKPKPIEVEATRPFEPEGRPLEGLILTIDPGHGGSAHQPGYSGSARGVNSRVIEGDLNMLVAGQLFHHLQDAGARVYMTRRDDRKVAPGDSDRAAELGARTNLAEKTQSHLFLALHHNSAPRATADGVVILIYPKDKAGNEQPLEKQFAAILREEVEKKVHHNEKFDAWENDHPLVSGSDIPSAVIEFGFLSNPDFDAWVSVKGRHREEAIGAYNGVVRMWTEHRAELEAKRAELFPDAKPVVPPPSVDPDDRLEAAMTRLAARLNPSGVAPKTADQADGYIELYKKVILSDRTSYYLNVSVEGEPGAWRLAGETNQPILKRAAGVLVEALGYKPLDNQVRLLPSGKLGAKKFGVVQIPMAFTWGEPREGADVQTQLLLGEPVFLLDETEDGSYLLLHGGDSYVGWVRSETVRRMDAEEFGAWANSPMARVIRSEHANDLVIPGGAVLPLVSLAGDTTATLTLPSVVGVIKKGPTIDLPASSVASVAGDVGARVVATALEYLTVPYVFGGRSPQGIDCSGLVGVSYSSVGLVLPRDANQQAIVGKLVATPWYLDGLRPGDALFFIDETGRVIHAGISLGGTRFVHCSPPEVQVSSLDPADPLYSKTWHEAFAFARRPLP
jgi:N-acetylmuramoyl-L-alanine amidase/cell wall-associated NlpC family hydrolase